jgi:catechol 2,3-dioxygenase-like lactoylglutathione lyase family enzyme
MIDHVVLVVRDYAASKAFYEKALAPLGVKLVAEYGASAGFGREKPDLWLGGGRVSFWNDAHQAGAAPIHVAIAARSREEVDAFYEAAIAAGARDFGKPGPRPIYHANYYGAFVLDPDGNNLEAVFHGK